MNFPYLYDASQETAKAYQAACTPDFFLFDKNQQLVYRGQMDDSRPGNSTPVTGETLKKAVQYVLEGKEIDFPQKPSTGCNIKWKEGKRTGVFFKVIQPFINQNLIGGLHVSSLHFEPAYPMVRSQ